MKSRLIHTFLFLLILNVPHGVFANELIGYRHEGVRFGEKLPNGAQDLGGGLLSDDRYGVTRFRKNKEYMLWLEKIVSRNKAGVPKWEVRDVIKIGKLDKNRKFLFSYSSPCLVDGQSDLDLIVLAKTLPRSKKITPEKAWIADVSAEKFKSISVQNISCK